MSHSTTSLQFIHIRNSRVGKVLAFACLFLLPFVSSCTIENYDDGGLDGFWHLEQVDTLSTGGSNDLSSVKRFWGFQGKLLAMYDYPIDGPNPTTNVISRFKREGDKVRLYDFYMNDRDNGDDMITDVDELSLFGISKLDEQWVIVRIDHGTLVLRSDRFALRFRKF